MTLSNAKRPLHLAFYGDDFTGSTDALESLARAGMRTMLFLVPPTLQKLASYPQLDAVGIAGFTRALQPQALEAELRPALAALRVLRPCHVHYKVCSTFDSSPSVGSIGRAIDVGMATFGSRCVPLVVGAPALGRFCVFGNLFARLGTGVAGEVHRLDRHPSVSRHPVTPMTEADLRQHLGKQTARRIGLIDVLTLDRPERELRAAWSAVVDSGAEIVLFDVLRPDHAGRIGSLLHDLGTPGNPLFSVGSSALGSALAASWRAAPSNAGCEPRFTSPGAAAPLLVVSGSCSPVTSRQIEHALSLGFTGVALAPDGGNSAAATAAAFEALRAGRHTVVYSSLGPLDPATGHVPAEVLGSALGGIARAAVEQVGVRRVLIAGGDTSSFAARALGIDAVEMIAPLTPGAPLCRARASGNAIDGLEVNFKGGQVGADNYFEAVARGSL